MLRVVSVVLTIGVLGSGLLGAGITMVQEREENILRRFKVTPSGALPILLAVADFRARGVPAAVRGDRRADPRLAPRPAASEAAGSR